MSMTVDTGYPPASVSDETDLMDVPKRMSLTFNGAALRKIVAGATLTHLTPQDFVRQAVRFAVEVADMRRRGYKVFLRDERGVEYAFPPHF